jgi:Xaa-Pro aminopeptidase
MINRIRKLQTILTKENLDFLLISFLPHVRYLSGYSGSNGLILASPKDSVFLTDFRYKDQAKQQVRNMMVVVVQRDLFASLAQISQLKSKRVKLGFEAAYLNCKIYRTLRSLLPDCLMVSTEKLTETLTIKKDNGELARIKKAVKITDDAFSGILDFIKPGVKELDIAAELEYKMKKNGSSAPFFQTIVASGKRSALPHGVASNKKIQKGDFVTMDFGGVYDGYTADLTRTVMVGRANRRQKQIYNIVYKAQKLAVSKTRSRIKACDLDKTARDFIKRAGYGKYFGHGLGHGIGLQVHDNPAVNPTNQQLLEPGMVITIEPGIYLPNWGGVRIEDDVLITQRGCQVLNTSPKELIEL